MKLKSETVYSYRENKNQLIKLLTDSEQKIPAFQATLDYFDTEVFLIEDNYVDRDYLEDYTSFYARCHHPYARFCKRIHFFTKTDFYLTNELLKKVFTVGITQKEKECIQNTYIGFLILKPSKNEGYMIGRTCLTHYNDDSKRNRKYYATREYLANLYGIPLTVKSMAFQEQDQTVAACASIALWSAFNITGKKYQHRIPSPSEVTQLALSEAFYGNGFPNEGLTTEQMSIAVSKVRLKPFTIRPDGNTSIKAHIYAYLRAGIPIICGISLYNKYKASEKSDKDSIILKSRSFHAVTINGFSFENGEPDIVFRDRLKLVSSRMTQFYVHDDQLCPFAKMVFHTKYSQVNSELIKLLSTKWSSKDKNLNKSQNEKLENDKVAKIDSLIIPLYHKIRITYKDVLEDVQEFAKEMNDLLQFLYNKKGLVYTPCEWDIFLSEVNDLKKDILEKPHFDKKETILKQGFAKYLWRAQAVIINENDLSGHKILLEIVFDATDSKKRGLTKQFIFYDEDTRFIFDSFYNAK